MADEKVVPIGKKKAAKAKPLPARVLTDGEKKAAKAKPLPARVLTDGEMDTFALIEAHANSVEKLVGIVGKQLDMQLDQAVDALNKAKDAMEPDQITEAEALMERIESAMPANWLNIANMHLKQGFMALRRSITQPTNF